MALAHDWTTCPHCSTSRHIRELERKLKAAEACVEFVRNLAGRLDPDVNYCKTLISAYDISEKAQTVSEQYLLRGEKL